MVRNRAVPRGLSGRRAVLLIGLGALFFNAWPAASAQEVTLETIRREYAASLAPLKTVWAKSRLNRSMTLTEPEVGDFTGSPVEWAIDGRKWQFTFDLDGPDRNDMNSWHSYDGRRVWRKRYSNMDEPGKAYCLVHRSLASATDNRVRSHSCIGTFLGLYLYAGDDHQNGLSLQDLLSRSDATFVRSEIVTSERDGEVQCYKVKCQNPAVDNSRTWPVTVWFDPSRGFLPRTISREMDGGKDSFQVTFTVEHFHRVQTAAGTTVWFPQLCVYRHPFGWDVLHVDEVEIGSLPTSVEFTPRATPDVPAFNGDDPRDVDRMWRHWANVHGRKEAIAKAKEELKKRLVTTSNESPVLPEPELVAEHSSFLDAGSPSVQRSRWLMAGVFLLLVGACLLYRRR